MAFLRQSAAAEFREAILLHDDGELLAEALADGNAFSGVVVQVRDEGVGRTTMPVWTLSDETRGPLRLREEQSVCVVGLPRRVGRIRSISTNANGDRFIEVALTNLKTPVRGATGRDAIPPRDQAWIGQPLTFATASAGSIEEAKIRKLWTRDVTGAWLTRSSARDTRTFGSEDTVEEVADVG
jgi:hypothetical protein